MQSVPAELPRFAPSPHWGVPVVPPPSLPFAPVATEVYEEVLAGLARFVGGVAELFDTRRPGDDNMMGFESLYLGPSGRFFLLHPHTHLDTAGRVIRSVHPGVPAPGPRRSKGGGWSHRDLTLVSGIQRVQIYRDGMGVTVNLDHPPNLTQLGAVREAYARTPTQRFAAEVDSGGRTLVTLGAFGELVEFVNGWDPSRTDEMVRRWPWLADLDGRGTVPEGRAT
jgi:hypothetical protein